MPEESSRIKVEDAKPGMLLDLREYWVEGDLAIWAEHNLVGVTSVSEWNEEIGLGFQNAPSNLTLPRGSMITAVDHG